MTCMFMYAHRRHEMCYFLFLLIALIGHLKGGGVGSFSPKATLKTARSSVRMVPEAEDAAAYNAFVSAAVDITDAYVRNGIVTVTRSARDIDANTRRSFLYHIPVPTASGQADGKSRVLVPPPTETSSKIKARIPSPSGDKIALLVEEAIAKNGEDAKAQDTRNVFEIWADGGSSLVARIVLSKEVHGKVCTDLSWFGGFSWSPDETVLVYAAEACPPKTSSYFESGSSSSGENKNDDVPFIGGQFTLGIGSGEDWGEKYTETSRLSLFCINVETGNIGLVSNVPGGPIEKSSLGGYTLGQPVFSPCGKTLVYVGWDAGGGGSMPRRLGSIYCYQRPAKLYSSPITNLLKRLESQDSDKSDEEEDDSFVCLTPDDRLARSPRFSPKSKLLVYLCNPVGFDTHGGCMELHSQQWDCENDTRRVLVKEVKLPSGDSSSDKVGDLSFPGLFVNQIPTEPFDEEGRFVFMTTQWGSITKAIRVDCEDGTVQPLSFAISSKNPNASQSMLSVSPEGAIVAESEPHSPVKLGFLKAGDAKRTCAEIKSIPLFAKTPSILAAASARLSPQLFGLKYEVMNMHPTHGNIQAPVQAILLLPNDQSKGKIKLIAVPHGGPHSCTSSSYMPSYSYLCQSGNAAVLHINYRGSSGFGQTALESLAGTAGSLDVKDVVHACKEVLNVYSDIIDSERVGICGGSHGGYLAGHCIGQYPELFKVAAMRNPVTNIASMVTSTDIPDWCYCESLGTGGYDWKSFRGPTKQELGVMFDASPIAHVDNVKAPTLVALGMSDRRVPPSQGLEYYYTLRSKGIKTKLLIYSKDDHAIDRVSSEADHWVNIKRFFDEFL